MKLKIISDGTPRGSSLVDDRTNEPVENVTFIELVMDAKHGVRAAVRFEFLKVDVRFESWPGAGR